VKKNMILEESTAAPAITPDLVAKLKKQDMQQAVVERFRVSSRTQSTGRASRPGNGSPAGQPAEKPR